LDTRDFNFLKVNDGPYQESDVEITEAAMFGSKRKSMQRFENATLIVNHKKSVDEAVRGSRSRYIESIFIENNGERFRFPVNYLNGARAMAVHVSEGGTPYDAIGQHIISTVTEMQNLAKFARMTKRHAMENTDSAGIRDSVVEVYHNIKKDIRGFYWSKKAWYAEIIKCENDIVFGLYGEDGGTSGEMIMKWYNLGGGM
jgi:hypothetical protein